MNQSKTRDLLATLVFVLLGPICCLGLPLLLGAVAAGTGLWLIGAGLPVALAVAVAVFLVARQRRARSRGVPRA